MFRPSALLRNNAHVHVRLHAASHPIDTSSGHHLTLGLAILAAYAYAFVVGQVAVEECHLIGTRLLQAEQRRLLVVYHVYGCLLAVLPAVVAVGIGRGAHADVVRYDLDGGRLLRRAARYQRGGAYDKRKDFLHCIL